MVIRWASKPAVWRRKSRSSTRSFWGRFFPSSNGKHYGMLLTVYVYTPGFFFLLLRFQHVCIDVFGPFAHLGNGFCICASLAETLSFTPCLAVFHLPKAYWIGSLFGKLKFFGVPRSVLFVNRKNGTSVEGIIAGGDGWNHLLQVSVNFLVCVDCSWD